MPETITVGKSLRIYIAASAGTLGDVTVTFPSPIGAVLGDVAADETIKGVLSHVRLFPAASGLAVGDYSLPVTVVLDDNAPVTVPLPLSVLADANPLAPTFTAKGFLYLWDGSPASSAVLFIGAQVEVRPSREGVQGSLDPTSYPPFNPPDGVVEPTPTPLFDSPPASLSVLQTGGGVPLRRVITDPDGAFSCVLPTPQALAYAAGARTDADMDSTRGGIYSVGYVAIMPDGRLVTFRVDTTALAGDGSLDITSLLATPPL